MDDERCGGGIGEAPGVERVKGQEGKGVGVWMQQCRGRGESLRGGRGVSSSNGLPGGTGPDAAEGPRGCSRSGRQESGQPGGPRL